MEHNINNESEKDDDSLRSTKEENSQQEDANKVDIEKRLTPEGTENVEETNEQITHNNLDNAQESDHEEKGQGKTTTEENTSVSNSVIMRIQSLKYVS